MFSMLQMLQTEDAMRRGAFTIVTKCYGMAHSMVHCLWNRVMHMCAPGHIISPEFHSHKKNIGRQPMYPLEFGREEIKDIPLWKQWTQRKLVMLLGVSKTTVHHCTVDLTI